MKRCPQCNRVETDDALAFCRLDGTALVGEAETGEIETSILPQLTDAHFNRPTLPTNVLPVSTVGTTHSLTKPRLKILTAIISLIVVTLIVVVGFVYSSRRSSSTTIQSIAVMPFVNESGNTDFDYLSDGMTETLIRTLSQLPKVNVKARSSVFRYKGKSTDANIIGKELNVQAVLNGRLMQRGDQLTLSLELVNADTENVIWSEQYDRKQADLVSLQGEIARDVLSKLRKLSGTDEARVTKNYTANPEAYQLYLKGRFYWDKRTEDGMRKSIEYFGQAIERDPSYALAYSGLADSYTLLGAQNATLGGSPSKEMFPKAHAAARKAVEADDTLAEAHVSLAHITLYYPRDWASAEREYKRAIELNPNYGTAHHWYAVGLMMNGRFDESLAEIKKAQELEPLSLAINTSFGWILWARREYDKSAEQLRKTLEMDSNFMLAHYRLGKTLLQNRMYEEAINEFQESFKLSGGGPLGTCALGQSYAMSGKRAEAQKVLAQLQDQSSKVFVSPYHIAIIYAVLGEKDQAFIWLEKSYEEHDGSFILMRIDPGLDSLRSDPRFSELARRMSLPQ